jgi:hypothetical protein
MSLVFGFKKKKPKTDFFTVAVVPNDGADQSLVTYIDHDLIFERGLLPEWIVGVLHKSLGDGGELIPENFSQNSVFVDFLHRFVAETASQDRNMLAAARSGQHENLFIIDQRTATPQGDVPPEDVIGVFMVENGTISASTYRANRDNHRILSNRGFFDLGEEMMGALQAAATSLLSIQ